MSATIGFQFFGASRAAPRNDRILMSSITSESKDCGLLSPATRADPDLRHLHGRGQRASWCGPAPPGRRGHARGNEIRPGRRRAAGGLRPDAQATTCSTARSATTTTAIARSTTRPRCSRWSTRKFPFKPKPYEVDATNPFYRTTRPVRALRPLRRGLPERRGERDALHQLGRPAPARLVGRRQADRRIELRLVRPLRDRLPLQRADGKIDARQAGYMSGCRSRRSTA
jgi:hypothetical protein